MALGGVATGSIKAHDADMVAGIIKSKGLTPRASAVLLITGSKAAVVAVLLVNSVRKVIKRHIVPTINKG